MIKKKKLQFDIITIFPQVFANYFSTSIIKRAQIKKLIRIKIYNLRDFATDKHKTVDDRPYGGGPGMILKADVIYRAISKLKIKTQNSKIVLLTPAGKQFNQKLARKFSKLDRLILICGHYEGVDARVEKFVDEKISVGPYVLTGGELPAMIVVDTVTRLIPGVIKTESLQEETNLEIENCKWRVVGEYPQYTRPPTLTIRNKSGRIKTLKVPKVLLSGNHQKIKEWRTKKMIKNNYQT
jgi:tRNA (guanine37-N1)-methyltransferase